MKKYFLLPFQLAVLWCNSLFIPFPLVNNVTTFVSGKHVIWLKFAI